MWISGTKMTELQKALFSIKGKGPLIVFLLFCLLTGPYMVSDIMAQIDSNPRALSMGGAFTAVARNYESPAVNPANLGLDSPRNFTLLLGLPSFYFDWHNTSFDTGTIDKYDGKYLTEGDKRTILNDVSDGLGLKSDLGYDLFGMSYGRFGMSVSIEMFSEMYLPRAPLEFLLNGTYVGQNISLTDVRGDFQTALVTALSYAHPLDGVIPLQPLIQRLGLTQTSVGFTIKPLIGLANVRLRTPTGNISMESYSMNVASEMTLRMAGTEMTNTDNGIEFDFSPGVLGNGIAFDIGLACSRGDRLTLGIALRNLFGGIKWNKDTYEARYTISADSLNVVAVAQDTTGGEAIYSHSDSSYSIGAYTTNIPTNLSIGAAYHYEPSNPLFRFFARDLIGAVDLEKGFSDGLGISRKFRLSFGLEQGFLWGRLPLRYGISFGGGDEVVTSFGLGINLPGIKWDLGFMNYGFTESKGTRIATRFWFGS